MAVGDLISASDYEALRVKVASILGTGSGDKGYGQQLASSNNSILVATNNRITSAQWLALRTDLVKARQHQIGFPIGTSNLSDGANLLLPSTGTVISDELLQQYISFANQIETDRHLVDPSELVAEPLVIGRQSTPWNGTLTHTATLTGNTIGAGSAENLRFFFNAGGSISIDMTRTGGTVDNQKNLAWNSLFNAIGTVKINYTTTTITTPNIYVTAYSKGYEDLNQSNYELLLRATDSTGNYPGNAVEIYAKKSADNKSIIIKTDVIDGYTATSGVLPDDNPNGILEIRFTQNRPASTNVTINPLTSDQTITAGAALAPTYSLSIVGGNLSFDEGSTISVLVNTTNIPNNTTLYWTVTGTVTANDFQANQNNGSVTINSNSGTFDIALRNDTTTEGIERFKIQLRVGSTSGTIVVTSSEITVNDTSTTPATYAITQSATSIGEGQTVVFTVTTTDVANGTILYWKLNPVTGTVDASDFTDAKIQGQVTIGVDGKGTFSRTLSNDLITEGEEKFTIGIYPTAISNSVLATSSVITVSDTSVTPPTYLIEVAGGVSTYNEGDTITFNVTTTNFLGSTLYWTTIGTVDTQDFSGYGSGNQNGQVIIAGQSGTIQLIVANDLKTEGDESFAVQLRTGSVTGPVVSTSTTVTIKDTSKNLPTYVSVTPSVTTLNEGQSVTFNVTTNFVADGTVLNWVIEGVSGTINASDFTDNVLQGTLTIGANKAAVLRTLKNDLTTEGAESFRMKIYHPSDLLIPVLTSVSVSVADTSRGIPTYALTTSGITSINEGSPLSLYVNTTNVDNGTVLYWNVKYLSGSTADDFNAVSGIVTINSNTGTFTVTPKADNLLDGPETFQVELKTSTSSTASAVATSEIVEINDTSVGVSTYTVVPSVTSVNEGQTVTFTISTSNRSSSPTIFWKIRGTTGTIDSDDFVSPPTGLLSGVELKLASVGSKQYSSTVTLQLEKDLRTEGVEIFVMDISETNGGLAVASSTPVTINDTSGCTITNVTSVEEGVPITFYITTTDAADNTRLFWSIIGQASAADFIENTSSGQVTIIGNKAEVTLTPSKDSLAEGTETFNLQLRRVSATGPIIATSSQVSIIDASTPVKEITITPSVTTVNEGNTVTFNVATKNYANGTTLYWELLQQQPSVNVLLILDTSGSMGSNLLYNGVSRKKSLIATDVANDILNCLDTNYDQVKVRVVTFSTTATVVGTQWSDIATARTQVNNLPASGNTNYAAAIDTAISAWNTATGKLSSAKNLIYFISDGVPTTDLTSNDEVKWKSFLNSNFIVSRAYGIGDSTLNIDAMNRVAWNGEINTDADYFLVNSTISCSTETIGYITLGDFNLPSLTGTMTISSPGVNGTASVPVPVKEDFVKEGTEYFIFRVRESGSSGPIISTSPSITILDNSIVTITTDKESVGNTIKEGESITFTFRVTGTPADQLYWSTAGTVNSSDFTDNQSSGLLTFTGGVATVTRTLTTEYLVGSEGLEYFVLQARKASPTGDIIASSAQINVNDVTFSIATSANSIKEGETVTFNITTTNVANGTVFNWTLPGASNSNFTDNLASGTVTIQNNMATVTKTASLSQGITGDVTFKMQLRNNSSVLVAESTNVTIGDVSISMTPSATTVDEGDVITIDVDTTNVANGTSYYWYIPASTGLTLSGSNSDFVGGVNGNITINSNTATITISIREDLLDENTESFTVALKANSTATAILAETVPITITDTSAASITISGGVTSVNEGGSVTYDVTATDYGPSTLNWAIRGTSGTVNASDFSGGQLTGTVSIDGLGQGSFTLTLASDSTTETTTEKFVVDLKDLSGNTLATSGEVTIVDTSKAPVTYAASVNRTTIYEYDNTVSTPNSVTITFTGTGLSGTETHSWNILAVSGSLDNNDFTTLPSSSLSFTPGSPTATVTLTVNHDHIVEGNETFKVQLRNSGGSVLAETPVITIIDHEIQSVVASPANVNEGSQVTVTVTTNHFSDGTVLYWTVLGTGSSPASNADFLNSVASGQVTINSNSGQIILNVANDTLSDSGETFVVQIRKDSVLGAVLATSNVVTIGQVTYTVSETSSTINEGQTMNFNVVAPGVTGTLKWRIVQVSGTVNASDFSTSLNGTVSVVNGAGLIPVTAAIDTDSSTDVFKVELLDSNDVLLASSGNVTINNVTASVAANSLTMIEGGIEVTFTVATNNFGSGTLFYSLDGTSVTDADFLDGKASGSVTITSNSGSFKKSAIVDTADTADESFVVNLRVGSITGPIIATSSSVSLRDRFAEISPSAPITVKEGEVFGVSLTTRGIVDGTVVDWKVVPVGGKVNQLDFISGFTGSTQITSNAASFNIELAFDPETNLDTNSSVDKFQVEATIQGTGIILKTATITIEEVYATVSTSKTTYLEGESITFTVNTFGVNSGRTVYWKINSLTGTVNSSDFSGQTTSGQVTLSGSSFTITRPVASDGSTETSEVFEFEVRLNSQSERIIGKSVPITINDQPIPVAVPVGVYTINNTTFNEGDNIVITVDDPNLSNITWIIDHVTTDSSDFTTGGSSGYVNLVNGKATITIPVAADFVSELAENFNIRLTSGLGTGVTVYKTFGPLTINNTSTVLIFGPTEVYEGTTAVFPINTVGMPNGTLYWRVSSGTASTTADFSSSSGTVTISGGVGNVSVPIIADSLTEGNETFVVQIAKDSSFGTIVATSSTVTIIDTSKSVLAGSGTVTSLSGEVITLATDPVNLVLRLLGGGGGAGSADGNSIGGNGGAGGYWYAAAKLPATAQAKKVRIRAGGAGGGGSTGDHVPGGPGGTGYAAGGKGGDSGTFGTSGSGGGGGGTTTVEYSTDNGATWQLMLLAPGGGGGGGSGQTGIVALGGNKNGNFGTPVNLAIQGEEGEGYTNTLTYYPNLATNSYDSGGGGGGGGGGGVRGKLEIYEKIVLDKGGNPVGSDGFFVIDEIGGTGGSIGAHYYNSGLSWETVKITPISNSPTGNTSNYSSTYGKGGIAIVGTAPSGTNGIASYSWTNNTSVFPAPPSF